MYSEGSLRSFKYKDVRTAPKPIWALWVLDEIHAYLRKRMIKRNIEGKVPHNCPMLINFWKGMASQRWNIHLLICSDLFQFIILMLASVPHLAFACMQSQQGLGGPRSRCKSSSEHISTGDVMKGTESYKTTAVALSYFKHCYWENCCLLGNTFQETAHPLLPSFIIRP